MCSNLGYIWGELNPDHNLRYPARGTGAHVFLCVHSCAVELDTIPLGGDPCRCDHTRCQGCNDKIRWGKALAASVIVPWGVRDKLNVARIVSCSAAELTEVDGGLRNHTLNVEREREWDGGCSLKQTDE